MENKDWTKHLSTPDKKVPIETCGLLTAYIFDVVNGCPVGYIEVQSGPAMRCWHEDGKIYPRAPGSVDDLIYPTPKPRTVDVWVWWPHDTKTHPIKISIYKDELPEIEIYGGHIEKHTLTERDE